MPSGLFKTVLIRNYTARFAYSSNHIENLLFKLDEISDGGKTIFTEFRKYKLSAVKVTMIPLQSRVVGNRTGMNGGGSDGTTDINPPLFWRFSNSEIVFNQPGLINDPIAKHFTYGRTMSFYRKIRTPLLVGAQGISNALDMFPKNAPWFSTQDTNIVHGRFYFATANWDDTLSEVPQDLCYNVNVKYYIAFKDHIA